MDLILESLGLLIVFGILWVGVKVKEAICWMLRKRSTDIQEN